MSVRWVTYPLLLVVVGIFATALLFAFVAAMKHSTGRPDRFAMRPAVRLPKLPLGVEKIGGRSAASCPADSTTGSLRNEGIPANAGSADMRSKTMGEP